MGFTWTCRSVITLLHYKSKLSSKPSYRHTSHYMTTPLYFITNYTGHYTVFPLQFITCPHLYMLLQNFHGLYTARFCTGHHTATFCTGHHTATRLYTITKLHRPLHDLFFYKPLLGFAVRLSITWPTALHIFTSHFFYRWLRATSPLPQPYTATLALCSSEHHTWSRAYSYSPL